uniref:Uncharacterized protein n=1 Tax=Peronospora matthiolae TaxID=2874970 RepID=A0AAV1V8I6_9STRA
MGDNEAALKTYQTGLIRDPNNSTLLSEKRTLEMALSQVQRGKEHLAAVRAGFDWNCSAIMFFVQSFYSWCCYCGVMCRAVLTGSGHV